MLRVNTPIAVNLKGQPTGNEDTGYEDAERLPTKLFIILNSNDSKLCRLQL